MTTYKYFANFTNDKTLDPRHLSHAVVNVVTAQRTNK
jgi:hypothetical protein